MRQVETDTIFEFWAIVRWFVVAEEISQFRCERGMNVRTVCSLYSCKAMTLLLLTLSDFAFSLRARGGMRTGYEIALLGPARGAFCRRNECAGYFRNTESTAQEPNE